MHTSPARLTAFTALLLSLTLLTACPQLETSDATGNGPSPDGSSTAADRAGADQSLPELPEELAEDFSGVLLRTSGDDAFETPENRVYARFGTGEREDRRKTLPGSMVQLSPAGERLLFTRNSESGFRVMLVPPVSDPPTGEYSSAQFDPAGSTLLLLSVSRKLEVYPDQGERREYDLSSIIPADAEPGYLRYHPGSERLALAYKTGSGDEGEVLLQTWDLEQMEREFNFPFSGEVRVNPLMLNSYTLLYLRAEGGARELVTRPLDRAEHRTLFEWKADSQAGPVSGASGLLASGNLIALYDNRGDLQVTNINTGDSRTLPAPPEGSEPYLMTPAGLIYYRPGEVNRYFALPLEGERWYRMVPESAPGSGEGSGEPVE